MITRKWYSFGEIWIGKMQIMSFLFLFGKEQVSCIQVLWYMTVWQRVHYPDPETEKQIKIQLKIINVVIYTCIFLWAQIRVKKDRILKWRPRCYCPNGLDHYWIITVWWLHHRVLGWDNWGASCVRSSFHSQTLQSLK